MTYGYNLAGSQISFTYPSGRVVTTAYDSADRFSTVQDVYNGTSSTHASSINYWPNRTIQTAILGHPNLNGYSIVDSTTLNSRLQVSNRSAQLGSVFPVQLNVSKPKSATTRSAESPSKWNGC
jgi:YD repeat-containing protein